MRIGLGGATRADGDRPPASQCRGTGQEQNSFGRGLVAVAEPMRETRKQPLNYRKIAGLGWDQSFSISIIQSVPTLE